jgi:class 3 adenylate cyclase
MDDSRQKRRISAVLAADVAGYTRLVEEDVDATVQAWTAARADVIDPNISKYAGQIVKRTGDGFLAEFPTVQEALLCALAMQGSLARALLDFRMGISVGEVVDDGDDIHGEEVNVAARLEALAQPGGVCVSGQAYDQARGEAKEALTACGRRRLKNVADEIGVWHWPGPLPDEAGARDTALRDDAPRLLVSLFAARSDVPDDRHLAEAVTEDLIGRLSRSREIFVLSRFATFQAAEKPVLTSAQDARAGFMVEGAVQRAGERVRITARLTNVTDNSVCWSEQYDGDSKELFELQDRTANAIAIAIVPELLEVERARLQRKNPEDLSLWQLWQTGMGILWKYRAEDYPEAIRLFRHCIALDERAAPPQAGLAYVLVHALKEGVIPFSTQLLDDALSFARSATRLDPRDPFCFTALGRTHIARQEYDSAIAAYTISLNLNPNQDVAHMGMGYALCMAGRAESALVHLDMGQTLIPAMERNSTALTCRSFALTMTGRFEEAIEVAGRARELPNAPHWAYVAEAMACARAGQQSRADAAIVEARRLKPELDEMVLRAAYPFAEGEEAQRLAATLLSQTDMFRTRKEAVQDNG